MSDEIFNRALAQHQRFLVLRKAHIEAVEKGASQRQKEFNDALENIPKLIKELQETSPAFDAYIKAAEQHEIRIRLKSMDLEYPAVGFSLGTFKSSTRGFDQWGFRSNIEVYPTIMLATEKGQSVARAVIAIKEFSKRGEVWVSNPAYPFGARAHQKMRETVMALADPDRFVEKLFEYRSPVR